MKDFYFFIFVLSGFYNQRGFPEIFISEALSFGELEAGRCIST